MVLLKLSRPQAMCARLLMSLPLKATQDEEGSASGGLAAALGHDHRVLRLGHHP